MDVHGKCPKCKSKKIDFKESINRFLYVTIYALVLMIIAWVGVRLNGTPVIFLFLGLFGAFVLFIVRLALDKKKIIQCTCLDCGTKWQRGPNDQ
ncbi:MULTISPECIES: hypothetical protein [Brevibacillus]|uniref:Uncharacterized protein n=2 Tax=Brevibacillus invocatus TaxID=173959 RepID=A0A3M8BYK9_9BACL|nr:MULTISPECIES: hypothetical protein [Brevibacillus]MCM3081862.1 hypothetical protein [Brevibacillus invocatus]MCM3432288.1 hypothetical protein [Brevibacillus invocatus]MDH4619858.1 hypothetical protein [Brevibacillus sp. AY1]RNB67785.1 hypothetical protein EDM52_21715 [Brevibacillus invocatus]